MENLHTSNDHQSVPNSLSQANEIKLGGSLYHSNNGTTGNIQTMSNLSPNDSSYGTQLSFTPMNIKEEDDMDDRGNKLAHGAIAFPSGSVITSASPLKANSSQILNTDGSTIVSQGMQLTSGGSVLVTSNEGCHKVIANQSVMPLGQSTSFNSSMNLTNTINENAIVPCSENNEVNQPVHMFHSSSFDNCEGVLNQPQHSGQAFLLASPGTVLSSNQLVSQGQMFLQGDELVGVTLATTAATSGYTVSNSDSQYVNTMPMVLGGNQNIGNSIPRLIIQSNQAGATNINNQILSSNAGNGHYLIQVGHSMAASQNNFSVNNKGHIVIKAGTSKIKDEPDIVSPPGKDGVFRVVIPEGTTKLPRLSHPLQVMGNSDDSIRKHVQINLSNRASLPSPTKVSHYDTAVQTLKEQKPAEKIPPNSSRKLYECTNCNSKFMKPLYLRMHMRSCKKPEVKLEKSPLYMCSFCKATFKTKPQINHHFTKCSHSPYNIKDTPGKRKLEDEEVIPSNKKAKVCNLDATLEMAVQYKCQDCDRTFSKERQYTSHVKRCTKVSVHDLSGARLEPPGTNVTEDEHESPEDPFADPPLPPPPAKRGRGGSGRRGRPPGRVATAAQKVSPKNDVLFEGETVQASCSGLVVADNENLVRSTTGLAHTVQLSLEAAQAEGQPLPMALVADSKGVRGMDKPPHAWSLICSMCQKMFLTKAALANHMIENHGPDLRATRNMLIGQQQDTEEKLYRCPLCHLHYQSSNTFIEHLVVQHTSKLQDHYKALQTQTATFVCSLCSLVLLTKNLLMEHLSLEHLDHLEKTHFNTQFNRQRKRNRLNQINSNNAAAASAVPTTTTANGDVKTHQNDHEGDEYKEEEEDPDKGKYLLDVKSEEGGSFDCGFCGEEFETSEFLVNHYTQAHNVQIDASGVLDVGMDIDMKVKNTRHLFQLADGKLADGVGNALPQKTVLIRKKPKQNWQCQGCQQVFSRQMTWLRHIRESCPSSVPTSNSGGDVGAKTPSSRECHFFCHEPDCSHLAFYQVKSLFKHMEEAHKIVVRKERKTFKSLAAYHQWLTEEENIQNVRFIRDSTRVEKSNVRLIQMVCHRFHSAKSEQAKERDESDMSKPTKKRWFMRIQRANNCHARIHLRVDFNPSSNDYDGETQMIYYPQHFHNGEEDTAELLERVREKHVKERGFGASSALALRHTAAANSAVFAEGDSGSSFSLDSTSDILQLHTDDNSCESQQQQHIQVQQQLHGNGSITSVAPMQVTSLMGPAITTPTVIISHPSSHRSSVIFDGAEQPTGVLMRDGVNCPSVSSVVNPAGKGLLMDASDENSFIVMNTDDHREETQDYSEEYVLPADDSEWTKLFDVLTTRIASGELSDEDKKEGEALLSYQNLIAVISISEQVSIFQRMCALTNTSLESV